MTPTLTNAQKYSSEFGFELGVTVEIIATTKYVYLGRFGGMTEDGIKLSTTYDELDIAFSFIKSIRILSGPFSIFNFAPIWAFACRITSKDIVFYDKDEYEETYPVGVNEVELPAPWWWLEGQK